MILRLVKNHAWLAFFLSQVVLVAGFCALFLCFSGNAYADCVVYEGQDPATAGCLNSASNISGLGSWCLNGIANDNYSIAVGGDFFVPGTLTIVNGATTPIELGGIGCNKDLPVGTNDIYYTNDQIENTPNTNNVVEFPNTYACGPNYVPCTPADGPLVGYGDADNTWTYDETTVEINGQDFPTSGTYVIEFTGYGTPCAPGGPVSPTCGAYTNLETTYLQVTVQVVTLPQPSVACGTFNYSLSGSTYSLTAPVILSNYTPSTPPDTITLSGMPDIGAVTYSYDSSSGTLTATATANPPPGNYTLSYTFSGNGGSLTATCAGVVQTYAKPYLKIYGGDVVVGSGFASDPGLYAGSSTPSCQSNSQAGIYAWNSGSPTYAGSSTSAGAFAVGLVDGFASGNGVQALGSDVGPPESLTFSNNNPATSPYGGDFGSAPCAGVGTGAAVKSYYTALQSSPYLATSPPTTITGYPSANSCKNVYTYSDQDVTISQNVSMSANVACPSSWASSANMPLFYVVVDGGNIYIDNNVTRLDGVYIAEPNSQGQGGNIYTCGNNVASQTNLLFNSGPQGCTEQLVVNGSFIAKDVDLQRTNGSTSSAPAPTVSDSCSDGVTPDDTVDANAAEVFCYSPLEWMSNPLPQSSTSFESINSLPPVL